MNTWIARWQPSSVSRGSSDHSQGSESFSSAATRGPARSQCALCARPGLAMNLSGASLCQVCTGLSSSPALQPPANLEPPWQWPALGREETQAARVPLLERAAELSGDSANTSTACLAALQTIAFFTLVLNFSSRKQISFQNQRLECVI